jgi:Lar family restriction alleviation protein
MIESEMSRCPFCGGNEAEMLEELVEDGWLVFYLGCRICGAHGPHSKNQEQADESWNKRELPDPKCFGLLGKIYRLGGLR